MNSLDWFQNGALLMLLAKAAYHKDCRPCSVVSGGLFMLGMFHMIIAIGELIKGNTP